ncbi:hypothetical protein FACS18949_17390 [Clostridia bacterium]|nr:hypothetical protein FACS18949_17390 [Clostridia bacterium]
MNPIHAIAIDRIHGQLGLVRNETRLDARTKAELTGDLQEGLAKLQRASSRAALYTPSATTIKGFNPAFSAEV